MCVDALIFRMPYSAIAYVKHGLGHFRKNSTQNTPIIAPTEHSHLTGSRQMELNPSNESVLWASSLDSRIPRFSIPLRLKQAQYRNPEIKVAASSLIPSSPPQIQGVTQPWC
jgi:hypothetical protein